MKILTVIGTRPEAIKMAPIIRRLQSAGDDLRSVVCMTEQHREMLGQTLELFQIRPDHALGVMRANQSLTQTTVNVMAGMDKVLSSEKPDCVLVQGDTTTAMGAALSAYYHQIPVGHVEAGLRTWNKYQPFPEEVNRKIIDGLCDLHFAPTATNQQNLLREGIGPGSIFVTGNTVIDALQWVAQLPFDVAALNAPALCDPNVRCLLVTAHRRENFGQPLDNICAALRMLAEKYPHDLQIVYPVHLNPNVDGPVRRSLSAVPNISLLPPLDYLPFVQLMKRSAIVLSDSGGIQEEAPGLGKPVLVLREITERPEAVQAGTARLVGTHVERIVAGVVQLLEDRTEYDCMARAINPYGDGHAAECIVDHLLTWAHWRR